MIFALSLCLPGFSPAKSKLNANLFEKTDSESSISGKIKAIREVQEETEVFIENKGNGGPYVLPQGTRDRAKLLKSLQKSLKAGGPTVTISIDDQQRIKCVEESQSSANPQSGW
jgi:hypothetical protein